MAVFCLVVGCRADERSENDARTAARLAGVREACGLIAQATSTALEVLPEIVVDSGPRDGNPRCSLDLKVDISEVPLGAEPTGAIRSAFETRNWTEDLNRTADGPGTSGFGFAKGEVYCEVTGGRPASLVDGEIRDDGMVYVDAVCSSGSP